MNNTWTIGSRESAKKEETQMEEHETYIYVGDDPELKGKVFEALSDRRPVGDGFYFTNRKPTLCCRGIAGACFLCGRCNKEVRI